MSLRFGHVAFIALASGLAAGVTPNDAQACGGCFHPEDARSTVVTSHRMALSISMTQTVLWDQVQYAGTPSEFAWVLPVKPGARIEVSTDAWFETLDAATTTRVVAPPMNCGPPPTSGSGPDYYPPGGSYGSGYGDYGSGYYGEDDPSPYYPAGGCGCGDVGADDGVFFGGSGPTAASGGNAGGTYGNAAGGYTGTFSAGSYSAGTGALPPPPPPPPVTVVHEGTVGPYETVTLHANVQGALTDWLTDNGYAIDADVQPIIDAYSSEGFDFIALRLLPDQGVQQMRPVRVVMPGAAPTLPLRMVAAGTGANVAITLFVIGEGRWEPENFPNALVSPSEIVWDFSSDGSNYAELRQATLETNTGRTWLSSYAKAGTLLKPTAIPNPLGGTAAVEYMLSDGTLAHTIAAAYFQQGFINGEAGNVQPFQCEDKVHSYADSSDQVVDLCAPPVASGGGSGGSGASGGGGAGGAGGGDLGAGGLGTGSSGGAGAGGAGAGGSGSTGAGGTGAGGSGTAGAGGSGEVCVPLEAGQIDSNDFSCGQLDDLGVAFAGMHPRDVWLTRLEAGLPREALDTDLNMQPTMPQAEVENWHTPTQATNNPCPLAVNAAVRTGPDRGEPMRRGGSRTAAALFGLGALALALSRRSGRGRGESTAEAF